MTIPTVTTPRLVLRGHTAADLDACHALWSDPDVVRHIGGQVRSREDCWGRVLRYIGHWHAMGFGVWAVIEAATGRYAGEVGYANFQRDAEPPIGDAPEGAWVIAPWTHGRGYATEALRAALAWDGGRIGNQITRAIIDADNAASIRVAHKLGYARSHAARLHGDEVGVYERPAGPIFPA